MDIVVERDRLRQEPRRIGDRLLLRLDGGDEGPDHGEEGIEGKKRQEEVDRHMAESIWARCHQSCSYFATRTLI
jgi:hypothetical protein